MASFAQITIDQLALEAKLSPWTPSQGAKAAIPNFDPANRKFEDEGMSIEFNHDIPMRDGVILCADIFLPADSQASRKLPIVLAFTAFGKQKPFDIGHIPPSRDFDPGLDGVVSSKYAPFEGSDPKFWTKQGFAYVVVDARGSFASQGERANLAAKSDGLDGYDTVEYLAALPWSNGRVGMIGASALGAMQW
jgi:putative CocE/NonD family hydrolase